MLLEDDQLIALHRVQDGLERIRDATDRLNALTKEHGLDVRAVPNYHCGLAMSDTQHIAELHQAAVQELREAAMGRLGRSLGQGHK